MRRHLLPLLAALVAAATTAGFAVADDERPALGGSRFQSIGLWGDVPYSDAQKTIGVPKLLADMNANRLAFSVHVGDIKSGGSRCDDAVYATAKGYFESLRAPALYTPGDNEWTDCDRPSNGAYSSRERLQYIRSTLFDTSRSFGQGRFAQDVQAAPYVENRRWQIGRVTYATLHVVGSDNNLGDVAPDFEEWRQRDAATNAWLRETFSVAEQRASVAVMLFIQANPGFDETDGARAPVRDPRTLLPADGFFNFLTELRREVVASDAPVTLVHGDSHYFRVDKPLLDRVGNRIEHFTRVEVPGDNAQSSNNDVQWVKASIDTHDPEVFSFEQEVVESNLVPYVP